MTHKLFLLAIILLLADDLTAKEWTLEELRQAAKSQNSLSKQAKLIGNASSLKDENLKTGYLPQLIVEAQATYQSDVFDLPINFPGFAKPTVPKDQYQITLNVNQVLYDGGAISAKREINQSEFDFNLAQNEANIAKSNDIINQLYFAIKLAESNKNIIVNAISQLNIKLQQLEIMYKNGALLKSNLTSIEIEILKLNQNLVKIEQDKNSLLQSLADWIGEVNPNSISMKDENFELIKQSEFNRSDLRLIEKKQSFIQKSKSDFSTLEMPKFFAFAKLGYGNPNPLNFFEESSEFYMLGLKMQWNFWNWNLSSRSEEILDVNTAMLENEKETISQNLNRAKIKFINDIEKYDKLILSSKEIISKQKEYNKVIFSQLQNGNNTTNDFLIEESKLLQAELNLKLQEIELLRAIEELNSLIINK